MASHTFYVIFRKINLNLLVAGTFQNNRIFRFVLTRYIVYFVSRIFDRLYGVTMQEPGVSKVVSVDMRKDLAASPAH